MSDIMIINNNGPRTVPCGTPLKTGLSLLTPPGNRTNWVLSDKNWWNHTPRLPVTPRSLSLCRTIPWSTLSKALEKSRYIMSTVVLLSIIFIKLSKTLSNADRHDWPLLKPCWVLFSKPFRSRNAKTCFLIILSKTLLIHEVREIGL